MTDTAGRQREAGASDTGPSDGGLGRRSLRVRLVLFVSVTLVVVCAAMALTTVLVQRAHLLGDLDQCVTDAAARSQGGLQRRTGDATDLGFLNERGQPAGTLAARFADGEVIAAEVVTEDGRQRSSPAFSVPLCRASPRTGRCTPAPSPASAATG